MTFNQYKKKLEHYCNYQDRCHSEVNAKMSNLRVPYGYREEIILHLIQENFLNEKRFVESFVWGKIKQLYWGKQRLIRELQAREISDYLINYAMKLIDDETYMEIFFLALDKARRICANADSVVAKKQIINYMMRRGWENALIYEYLD